MPRSSTNVAASEASAWARSSSSRSTQTRAEPASNGARVRPDVAFVDLGLPGFDGFELARRVRGAEGGRRVRLVALTGYGLPDDHRRSLEAGFDTHLVKPIDPARLAEVIWGGGS